MPEYQFEIANLWQQAGHTDKEIEVLEFLRGRFPRLQGVNRRLGDCYALTGDLDAAALRYQDEAYCDEAFKEDKIVRALLWKCGNREESLADRIKSGETPTLEFKSSLRWNIHKNAFDKDIENSVLKTIVAFCNTKGGELLIGVKDNGEILGLDIDNFKNADKFLLHLTNLLLDRIGPDIVHSVQSEIVPIQGKSICRVICKQSKQEVWLKLGSNLEHFFIRFGPSSLELTGSAAIGYIREHFDRRAG